MYQNPWILQELMRHQQRHLSARASSERPDGGQPAPPLLRWRRGLIFLGSWPAPHLRPRTRPRRPPAASATFRA